MKLSINALDVKPSSHSSFDEYVLCVSACTNYQLFVHSRTVIGSFARYSTIAALADTCFAMIAANIKHEFQAIRTLSECARPALQLLVVLEHAVRI